MEQDEQPGSNANRKPPRSIACTRCRTRKKKCDHAVPICGECRRSGAQCVQYGSQRSGKFTTIPVSYLYQLESRLSQLEGSRSRSDGLSLTNDSASPGSASAASRSLNSGYERSSQLSREEILVAGSNLDGTADEASLMLMSRSAPDIVQRANAANLEAITRQTPVSLNSGASRSGLPSTATDEQLIPSPTAEQRPIYSFIDSFAAPTPIFSDILPAGDDWLEHYAHMYFQHIQPQWSFLNESSWRKGFLLWRSKDNQLESSQKFIIRVVLAIGALLCNSSRLDGPHLSHASNLHDGAIRNHLSHIMQHPSALIRTQASLLLLIYILHGPSMEPIHSTLALVSVNCGSLITEDQERCLSSDSMSQDDLVEQQVRRHTIMSCHILNEVVSSGWTYSQSFMLEFLDQKIFEYATRMRIEKEQYGIFEHLFQLRCIQSKIRHYNRKLKNLDPSDQFREWTRTRLKEELFLWKESIHALTTNESSQTSLIYHNPTSLIKLYDYSVSILMQDQPDLMGAEDLQQLTKACSEACLTFRECQERDSVIYWTWSALMYQFRVGIMALYCYWIIPPTLRSPDSSTRNIFEGAQGCLTTIARFANRWPDASIFLRAYQLLAEVTLNVTSVSGVYGPLLSASGNPDIASSFPKHRKMEMEGYIMGLRMQHVHHAVISLIEEMVYKIRPQYMQGDSMDFVTSLPFEGMDLFDFDSDVLF